MVHNNFIGHANIHVAAGDFNGDGRDDILLWDSSIGEWEVNTDCTAAADSHEAMYYCWLKSWAIGEAWVPFIGDFNGDGMDDIVVYYPDTGDWQVALSDGKSFIPDRGRGDWSWLKSWAVGKSWAPLIGDFNGDGKDDIAVWNNVTGDWQVVLSSGHEFIPDRGKGSGSWLRPWAIGKDWIPLAGDFNGDGKDDIAVHELSIGDWQVALSSGSDFVPDIGRGDCSWLMSWAVGDEWIYYTGDINGDGKDDIAVFSPSTGELQVSFSGDNRFIASYINKIADNESGASDKGVLLGDFDGDGCDEVLLFSISESIHRFDIKIGAVIKPNSDRTVDPSPMQNGAEAEEDIKYIQAEKRYTIIQAPSLLWNEPIFQRSHQLMSEFARQGHFAIFTNIKDDGKGSFWFANRNLCISNDLKATLTDPDIRRMMEGTKIVLWITWPESIWVKDIINADIIVFDYIDGCTDEFASWNDKLGECMECADIITATSKRLFDHARSLYPRKTFNIPNGADIRNYFKKYTKVPDDLAVLKNKYKYIAGFIGTIYSWIDIDWVRDIAKERPEWGFVFIGPDYKSIMKHERTANIHYLGIKKYDEIAQYVRNFDVGLIPFQVREMTRSANPIKMYEYMAAGVPVISTPIDECIALSPYVRIAGTAKEAAFKIEEAVKSSQYEKDEYRSIAISNSWTKRVEDITAVLDCYAKKKLKI